MRIEVIEDIIEANSSVRQRDFDEFFFLLKEISNEGFQSLNFSTIFTMNHEAMEPVVNETLEVWKISESGVAGR